MTTTTIAWTEAALAELPSNYDADQRAAIDAAAALRSDRYIEYDRSARFAFRGAQAFVLFGDSAYELLSFSRVEDDERGVAFDYAPALIGGAMLRQSPVDEGQTGFAYFVRRTGPDGRTGKWLLAFMALGWLRADELALSTADIVERIAEEIDAGANVLAPAPAGWV